MENNLTPEFLQKYSAFLEDIPVTITRTEQGQGFKYTPLPEILDTIKPILKSHGLVIIQSNVGNPVIGIGITTTIFEVDGKGQLSDTLTVPFEVAEQRGIKEGNLVMTKIQGIGATITYLRRYGIVTIIGMASEDDADRKQATRERKKSAAKTIDKNQISALEKVDKANALPGALASAGFVEIKDIPVNRYQELYKFIEAKGKES